MQRIEPDRDGARRRSFLGEKAQRRKIANALIAHALNRLPPQRIKLCGDPKTARLSPQDFRQKRRIGNDGKMSRALRRFVSPNPMPPERQGGQRNVAERRFAAIGGGRLAVPPVVSPDLDLARCAVLERDGEAEAPRKPGEVAGKADRHVARLAACRCDGKWAKLALLRKPCEARACLACRVRGKA